MLAVECRPHSPPHDPHMDDDGFHYEFVDGQLRMVPKNRRNATDKSQMMSGKPVLLANRPEDLPEQNDEIGEKQSTHHQNHRHDHKLHLEYPKREFEIEETRILVNSKVIRGHYDRPQRDDFVFPDEYDQVSTRFVPPAPKLGCKPFCKGEEIYPFKFIEDSIRKRFGNTNISEFLAADLLGPIITQRIDSSDENPFCSSQENVVYPKSGQTKDDEYVYIVNSEKYKQAIRVELCRNEGSACDLSKHLPSGYKATCKQKYIYRKLLSVNKNQELREEEFKIPSCCSCYYTKPSSFRRQARELARSLTMSSAKSSTSKKH